MFAVLLPLLLLTTGSAIEYGRLYSLKTSMQSLSDGAAIAAARERQLADRTKADIEAAAQAYAASQVHGELTGVVVRAVADMDAGTVDVSLTLVPDPIFPTPFSGTELITEAKSELVGETLLCLLGLDNVSGGTIRLELSAQLTGNDCAVYSNSTRSDGIVVGSGGKIEADLVCSGGGGRGTTDPEMVFDCPPIDDPLKQRREPSVGGCNFNNVQIGTRQTAITAIFSKYIGTGLETFSESEIGRKFGLGQNGDDPQPDDGPLPDIPRSDVATLTPVVYCGGITIGGTADVWFEPGVYILKDGPLYVEGQARIRGEYVGFYFKGFASTFYFGPRTSVSLTAPKSDVLAGILFFEERAQSKGRLFSILSDDARTMTGTIYLSNGKFVIDADRPVFDRSAYTAIVASQMTLYAGPHVVLNSDYKATDIPVPVQAGAAATVNLIN